MKNMIFVCGICQYKCSVKIPETGINEMTFADYIISFLSELEYTGQLPDGISVMNPFRKNPLVKEVASQFYRKYYSDSRRRYMILGINPGRFGAGVTGIPFTDTKRLIEKCGIEMKGTSTFETSSVFVYDMIDAYGGPEKFYSRFYITAVSPLGFTITKNTSKEVNYNYYDSRELTALLRDFIIDGLNTQLDFGIERERCFCLGTGKNYEYLKKLNDETGIFGSVIPLEHPRFIMQYRTKTKDIFIEKYLTAFAAI
jgi:hypothetical protein